MVVIETGCADPTRKPSPSEAMSSNPPPSKSPFPTGAFRICPACEPGGELLVGFLCIFVAIFCRAGWTARLSRKIFSYLLAACLMMADANLDRDLTTRANPSFPFSSPHQHGRGHRRRTTSKPPHSITNTRTKKHICPLPQARRRVRYKNTHIQQQQQHNIMV